MEIILKEYCFSPQNEIEKQEIVPHLWNKYFKDTIYIAITLEKKNPNLQIDQSLTLKSLHLQIFNETSGCSFLC